MPTTFNLGKDSIKRPAGFQSMLQAALANAQALRPLTACQSETVMLDTPSHFAHTSGSSVALLFTARCPSTILGTVRSVVVDSVQGPVVWPVPHIGVESRERLFPRGTDGNSASTIVVKERVFGVCASLHHGVPGLILRRVRHAVPKVAVQAPTRKLLARFQVPCKSCKNAATLTRSKPSEATVVQSNGGNGNRSTEYLPGVVMSIAVKRYNLDCHFDTLSIEVARRARGRHPRLPPILTRLRG